MSGGSRVLCHTVVAARIYLKSAGPLLVLFSFNSVCVFLGLYSLVGKIDEWKRGIWEGEKFTILR